MKGFSILLAHNILVLALYILNVQGAALGLHQRRHSRSRGHVARLQDTVDQLLLRQKTDHILLDNLQKAVQELKDQQAQASISDRTKISKEPSSSSSKLLASVEAESLALSVLGDRMKEVRGTLTEALEAEERQDDMALMKQELAYLRLEVQRLKSARATEGENSAAKVKAHEQREAITAAWVADNVKRLQDSVVDLQQSLNVTQAMHDKQEVESRLLTVSKDVLALRGTMAAVTSKAEAAVATSKTLQEELARTTEDLHHSIGQVAAVKTEVNSIREDFNDLLTALPEGTMAGITPSDQIRENESSKKKVGILNTGIAEVVAKASHGRLNERLTALENRAEELDFAVSRTQKQLSMISPDLTKDERISELAESERLLETRVEVATTGVGEVKSSSVQLLAALDALEARLDKEISEVRQEVAKIEFNVAQTAAEQETHEKDDQTVHDDTSALRTDLQAVSQRLDHYILKMADLDEQRLEVNVAEAQSRTQHLSLDIKLSDILDRLKLVEEHFSRSHKYHNRRHEDRSSDRG